MSRFEAETPRPFLEKNHAHELKCYPGEFEAIDSGRKTCELRRDDCGYMVGHRLLLREFDSETGYSGRWLFVTVEHIIRAWDRAGMEGGYVVMSIKLGRFEGEPPVDQAPLSREAKLGAARETLQLAASTLRKLGTTGGHCPELVNAAAEVESIFDWLYLPKQGGQYE